MPNFAARGMTLWVRGQFCLKAKPPRDPGTGDCIFENDCETILSNGFVTPLSVERCGKAFSTHRVARFQQKTARRLATGYLAVLRQLRL